MVQTTKPQTSLGNTEFQAMIKHDSGQFLVFTAEACEGIEVRYQVGTIWLTQKLMAQLIDVDVSLSVSIWGTFLFPRNCRKIQLSGNSG